MLYVAFDGDRYVLVATHCEGDKRVKEDSLLDLLTTIFSSLNRKFRSIDPDHFLITLK